MHITTVDLTKLTATSTNVTLYFISAERSAGHTRTYDADTFARALPNLADPSINTRLEGCKMLGMSPTEGNRSLLILAFDDGSIGYMGVLGDHGPVNHLERLLHPDMGHDQEISAVLEGRAAPLFINNIYL